MTFVRKNLRKIYFLNFPLLFSFRISEMQVGRYKIKVRKSFFAIRGFGLSLFLFEKMIVL